MSDYTIKNLMDVEDMAVRFGHSPNLESRFASRDLELEKGAASYQRLAPGFRQPFGHRHHEQEELYVVVDGGGRVRLDDEVRELARWDALRVGPGTIRCFEAGDDGMAMLIFGAPKMESMTGDVVMERDFWAD